MNSGTEKQTTKKRNDVRTVKKSKKKAEELPIVKDAHMPANSQAISPKEWISDLKTNAMSENDVKDALQHKNPLVVAKTIQQLASGCPILRSSDVTKQKTDAPSKTKTTKKPHRFDQKEWCRANAIFMDPSNPEQVFEFVKKNHPFMGCSHLKKVQLNGDEDNETLSSYADAVIVVCCEVVGRREYAAKRFNSLIGLPADTLGAVAFFSLHHSDVQIKKWCQVLLNLWRTGK